MFPQTRMRRLRYGRLKDMVRENALCVDDLIYPFFIDENASKKMDVSSMPGVSRWPLSMANDAAREAYELGIPAILIFGIPKVKNAGGTSAYGDDDVVQTASVELKRNSVTNSSLLQIYACASTRITVTAALLILTPAR